MATPHIAADVGSSAGVVSSKLAMKEDAEPPELGISLPRAHQDLIRERVAAGDYASPSEYIRALIVRDALRLGGSDLDRELLEGLNSGAPAPFEEDYFEKLRRRVREAERRNGQTG